MSSAKAAFAAGLSVVCMVPGETWAVPGPDSVAVVANAEQPASVELAVRYARARGIPDGQVCPLSLPTGATMSLEAYRTDLEAGLVDCLSVAGVSDRIEAVVLAKGVPLRVRIPVEGGGNQRASTAATLAVWQSTLVDGGDPVVGQAPGFQANCGGSPCLAAAWPNPFRIGTFDPGWTRQGNGVEWRPLIVTMLEGRTHEQAARLVASATIADAAQPPFGEFLFMRGANAPRAVLDNSSQVAVSGLESLGYDARLVDFDGDLSGRSLIAFVTGSQNLGQVIEANTYLPGALVDNLTSLGAVPRNFDPPPADGTDPPQSQVSIARWVARGVAGVHGCTDEPLNNVFPDRRFVVDYAEGGTLGEAYFRRMPFAYWRNLVLGDPMAAPYAFRPEVTVGGLADGDVVLGSRRLRVQAEDPLGRALERVSLYVNGVEVVSEAGGPISWCLSPDPAEDVHVLALAQTADDTSVFGQHRPKGWRSLRVNVEPGPADCPMESMPDAGVPDAGLDAGAVADGGAADGGGPDMEVRADLGVPAGSDGGGGMPAEDGEDGGGCRCPGPGAPEPFPWLGFGLGALTWGLRRSGRPARSTPRLRALDPWGSTDPPV
jgi:hypothetical protein